MSANPGAWLSNWRGRIRRRFAHTIMESAGRTCAVLGEVDWVRVHVRRVCLGWEEGAAIHERTGWHGPDAVDALWRLAHRHGVAVATAVSLDPQRIGEVITAPRMIGLSRATPASMDDFLKQASGSVRGDVRSIKRRGYTWSYDPDLALLPEFMSRFHLPSINRRHGEEGFSLSMQEAARLQGSTAHKLMRIFRDGRWVAGGLVEVSGGNLWMRQLGWLDGSQEELRAGVVGAIYLASIERAIEQRTARTVFGVTDPFLEDGLFVYKAKWGAELDESSTTPLMLRWAFDPAHPAGRRFLQEHALIIRGPERGFAVIGALPKLDQRHRSLKSGLACWYRLLDQPDPARAQANPELPSRLRAWFVREPMPDF